MGLTFNQMMAHKNRRAIVTKLAEVLASLYQAGPRMVSVFSSQQRWLMAQAGIALYFREITGKGPPTYGATFLDKIQSDQIAARNTGHAFIQEMLNYGVIEYRSPQDDAKTRLLTLPETTIGVISSWVELHLAMLDQFGDGKRLDLFQSVPSAVAILQPVIADKLIESDAIRTPRGAFAHFTWLNEGGFIMDSLLSGIHHAQEGTERILTNITSLTALASHSSLSRTHLSRKFRYAEEQGFLGWSGRRGHSPIWVSSHFSKEYDIYQINKLALIEQAFETVLPELQALKHNA